MDSIQGIEKIKIPKNRHLRKEHPVWILLPRANMFFFRTLTQLSRNQNFIA